MGRWGYLYIGLWRGGQVNSQLLESRLILKPSFMKYLTVFIHSALEKMRNMDLNQTSILLTQGQCNVLPQVKCSFPVRASCIHSVKPVYSAITGDDAQVLGRSRSPSRLDPGVHGPHILVGHGPTQRCRLSHAGSVKSKSFYFDAVADTGGNTKRVFDLVWVMDSFNGPELCTEESGRV